ncbi:MAG: DEAD/DEAH box helicase [Candidatus Curtissbacteria bacterium]|nr:DEAD/DEAH box helicase [Candidatus Curtissbacteria bacterium]
MHYRSRSTSFGNHRSTNYSNYRRPSYGRRREKPKLDANLFVKRAQPTTSVEYVSTASFSTYNICNELKRNIEARGYNNPTPIQEQTIPILLEGRDVIGVANTGTGKTAAFLIPLVNKVFLKRSERVLIVTPTRELAMQIADEFRQFSRGMNLEAALCIGGAGLFMQAKNLSRNPHFVIGTPGRLQDLIRRQKLNLNTFGNVVLDEVDRMVDIGFIKEIESLIAMLSPVRQSLFFSATVSGKTKEILNKFVDQAEVVSVKSQDTAENIDQDVVYVHDRAKKPEMLQGLLRQEGFDKVLVFGQTKWGIERLTRTLVENGFKATSIHSNKSQSQRKKALELFKSEKVQVLLATDVASRGLDIDNVTHVINYDAPESYDEYIHRIGRTGRADKKGIALTFVE